MNNTTALRLSRVRAAVASGEARRLREEAQLTIGEVAHACGVDQSTVWRWEQGRRRPRGQPALELANLIDALRQAIRDASKHSDGASPEYQPEESAGNDEAAGYQPAAPVEQSTSTSTAK